MIDLDCLYSHFPDKEAGALRIALSAEICSPGLVGMIRPVILLSADIVSWTSPEERVSVIHHELAHIRRHDHLANVFQSVLRAFFFYHPMVRYACNQASLERELACDDFVLGLGIQAKTYAEAILKAVATSKTFSARQPGCPPCSSATAFRA